MVPEKSRNKRVMPVKNMIANAILSFRNMCVVLRNEKKKILTLQQFYITLSIFVLHKGSYNVCSKAVNFFPNPHNFLPKAVAPKNAPPTPCLGQKTLPATDINQITSYLFLLFLLFLATCTCVFFTFVE